MRIAFDGTTLTAGRTGVGYYTEHLLQHLAEEVERTDDDFLSAVLETWRGKFPDVEVTETLVEGRAGTHLVHASTGAGLLVLGRRVHDSPLGPRTGPVAHTVIRHASCPVAIVPHH